MAPAKAPTFLGCGRVLRPGRTLTVCLAEVFAIDGADRGPVATMTEISLKQSPSMFRNAIEIDPNYAQAWAGLSDALCELMDRLIEGFLG